MAAKDVITAYRKVMGINQEELARRCGLKQGQISRIERGDLVDITVFTAMKIARGMQMSVEEVFGERSPPSVGIAGKE